jgi:hypothetical protein
VSLNPDHDRISPEVMVRGFKECCVSDETNGREDKEEAGNVGSEHKSVSMNVGHDVNCEGTEAGMGDRNGEQSETGEGE